jgi:hypothetical protein
MAKRLRVAGAKREITAFFSGAARNVYSPADLNNIRVKYRYPWGLEQFGADDFTEYLVREKVLRQHIFKSEKYKSEIVRYSYGKPSLLEIASSLKPRAYFTHGTALALHGLAKLDKSKIYLNSEQSPKRKPQGALVQHGIDQTFSRKQRTSTLVYKLGRLSIIILSGKNTGQLAVKSIPGPAGVLLPATNLERTLIDIVVRPAYAGDALGMLQAYKAAKKHVSIDRLQTILKELDYVYPYHQSIGFLMQRAEYAEKDCAKLRALGLRHKFYLNYGIQQKNYSSDWQLHYPATMDEQ